MDELYVIYVAFPALQAIQSWASNRGAHWWLKWNASVNLTPPVWKMLEHSSFTSNIACLRSLDEAYFFRPFQ